MLTIERIAELPEDVRARLIAGLSPAAKAHARMLAGVLADLGRYEFRGPVRELWQRTDEEIVLSGPAGTGKSLGVLARIFDLAVHHPGARFLLVRKTHVSLTASGLVTWREKVVPESLRSRAVVYYGGSGTEPAQFRFWNGSKVMIGGMDNSAKVMSTEYDLVFVQEAIDLEEEDWEKLTTRLRNGVLPTMQIVGDTNPSTPTHWLKERARKGQAVMLECRHEDNPALFTSDGQLTREGRVYIDRLDRLTGVRYHRLRHGKWIAAEGMIWTEFDEAVHLVPRFDIPAEWPRYWSIDFGFTNPFVCQWWAQDPDGRLWMYREIYMTGRLVEDHARQIMSLVAVEDDGQPAPFGKTTNPGRNGPVTWRWVEPKPEAIIADHDAEDRATLYRHLGMATRAARKEVKRGIEAVAGRLRKAGDGRPRLLFLRGSLVEVDQDLVDAKKPTCLVDELPGYIWAPPTAGRAPKEDPLKVDDHGADAMRYLVMDRDRGAPQIRAFGR